MRRQKRDVLRFLYLGLGIAALTAACASLIAVVRPSCQRITIKDFQETMSLEPISTIPAIGQLCMCERTAPRYELVVAGRVKRPDIQIWLRQQKSFGFVQTEYDSTTPKPWHANTGACTSDEDFPSSFAQLGDNLSVGTLTRNQWQYILDVNDDRGLFELVLVRTGNDQ